MKKLGAAALSIVFVSLIVACASSTRSPQSVAKGAEASDAGTDDDESTGESDSDGDAEVSSELAMTTEPAGPCPTNMVLVQTAEGENAVRFCVDKYEASLVETDSEGNEKQFAHWLPVDGKTVRAVSVPDVFPQGFISEVQADDACVASGKRLCSYTEWKTACMGPSKSTFPYGNTRQTGVCHDTGKSAVASVFGVQRLADPVAMNPPTRAAATPPPSSSKAAPPANKSTATKPSQKAHVATKGRAAESSHARASRSSTPSSSSSKKTASASKKTSSSKKPTAQQSKRVVVPAKASTRPASVEPSVWTQLNDPRLGQVDGALSKTGSHAQCVNGYGAVDMVGNLHEWVKTDASLAHGTFAGGYYLDTSINGDGCQYKTQAHAHDYHDYSTGFRCCADAKAASQ